MNPYLVTAAPWASSHDPEVCAQAANVIHETAKLPTADLLSHCANLLHGNQNHTLHACAFNLFLHVVRNRWAQLSDVDKGHWISWSPNFTVYAFTSPWDIQNKVSMILSELVGKEGLQIWTNLVHATAFHLSSIGQPTAEFEVEREMIQCLSRGITIPDDSSKTMRLDMLKVQNWDGLSKTLFDLLDKHLEVAVNLHASGQEGAWQQHLQLALDLARSVCAYAQWAQIGDLVRDVDGKNLIRRCKHLAACEHLIPPIFTTMSEICLRIKPTDCDNETMGDVFDLLLNMIENPLAQPSPLLNADRGCELMTALGCSSLACILVDDKMTSVLEKVTSDFLKKVASNFLKKMLEYYQYENNGSSCHEQALLFWEKTLYEDEKKGVWLHMTDDMCVTCFCIAVNRLIQAVGSSSYRERLLGMIKVIASQHPVIAASHIVNEIALVYHNQENCDSISGAKVALSTAVNAIYCGSGNCSQRAAQALSKEMAKKILDSSWTEPKHVIINCDLLHCFDPYLSYFQEMVRPILDKLFELLRSLPTNLGPLDVGSEARRMVCLSLITVKQAVGLDFESHKEYTIGLLESVNASGSITSIEYAELSEELCDLMSE